MARRYGLRHDSNTGLRCVAAALREKNHLSPAPDGVPSGRGQKGSEMSKSTEETQTRWPK
jgi:hypothetical protein